MERVYNSIKAPFLRENKRNNEEIKSEVVKSVMKYGNESRTKTKREESSLLSTEKGFSRRTNGKYGTYKIKNEISRENLRILSVETVIKENQS